MFRDHSYCSLEAPDERAFAQEAPRAFLARFSHGAILDEVQRVPDLLSYLQGVIDADPVPGRWILNGSQNFALLESVSQSLAGRTAMHQLLPLSWDEVARFARYPASLEEALFSGGFPVSSMTNSTPGTGSSRTWRRTLSGMCAGSATSGIKHRKRLVKMPKMHFYDTGLACCLLGINEPGQLRSHPLRGARFETWVVSEVLKCRTHRGERAGLSYYRDRNGAEIDLLVEEAQRVTLVEAKSAATPKASLRGASRAQPFPRSSILRLGRSAGRATDPGGFADR